jgi:hypothetical protein
LKKPIAAAVLALLALPVLAQLPAPMKTDVKTRIDGMYPWLDTVYKDLHAHPEIAFQEVRTAGKLAGEMRKLGFEVTEKVGKTGIVAVYKNGAGPTVLVRTEKRPACLTPAVRRRSVAAARASLPTAAATTSTWPAGWARRAPWSN